MKKKETAYDQCQNCQNKKYEIPFFLICKSEGTITKKKLKQLDHCAAQNRVYYVLNER